MKVISVANVKGGVGKSTVSGTLASGLNLRGYKVLMIDGDPQTNLTMSFLAEQADDIPSLYHVYSDGESIDKVKIQVREGLDIVPGDFALCNADMQFLKAGRLKMLQKALKNMKTEYDFVIIDTSPYLGVLSLNAFLASTHIVVPMLVDSFSLKGARILKQVLDDVADEIEEQIPVAGVLITKYNKQTKVSKLLEKSVNDAAELLGTTVFQSRIRQAVAVSECQIARESLLEYAPKAPITKDYSQFIDELLERIGG